MTMTLVILLALSGCGPGFTSKTTAQTTQTTTAQPTKPPLDDKLIGCWTTDPDRRLVNLGDQGKPIGPIPVGEWIRFDSEGRYARIGRYMTFAIGGTHVEEGRFEASSGVIRLLDRTESFFPDQGSPQKAKYRENLSGEETFYYQWDAQSSMDVLLLKTGISADAVPFGRCADGESPVK